MISQETIRAVKEAAQLVDLVSESVSLRRQSSGFIGLCPFHSEKSPSFSIFDNGRRYHCFGCGVSGDAISFLMQTRGLSYPEAIEELAARYGIEVIREVTKRSDRKEGSDNVELFNVMGKAARFFTESLQRAPQLVQQYIQDRGLTKEALETFGIGFAPAAWNDLARAAVKAGVLPEHLLALGIARRNDRGDLYDFLRARLIFPIYIDRRRVSAFGGRVIPNLSDKPEQAKYLNTPESPIYEKRNVLYGLPQALQAIRAEREAIVVEGYMDVVGLWQAGVRNAVATCGTALSPQHVRRLGFLTRKVLVVFDGDNAGRAAAARAFAPFLQSELDAWALFLPQGSDPDSIARKYGARTKEFLNSLDRISLLDCYIDFLVRDAGFEKASQLGAAATAKISEQLAEQIGLAKSPIVQERLINEVDRRIGVRIDLNTSKRTSAPNKESKAQEEVHEGGSTRIDQLPALDRELLLAAMAFKETALTEILSDVILVDALSPATLQFLEGLDRIVQNDQLDQAQKKSAITALLKFFGESWRELWKKAYEMLKDASIDCKRIIAECRSGVRRSQIEELLRINGLELAAAKGVEEEERLLLQQRELLRQRKGLA